MAITFQTMFKFPALYSINTKLFNNPVQQIISPAYSLNVSIQKLDHDGIRKFIIESPGDDHSILAIENEKDIEESFDYVLLVSADEPFPKLGKKWIRNPNVKIIKPINKKKFAEQCKVIHQSWKNNFFFQTKESPDRIGLRQPQIGALFAALADRTISQQTVTIVMPTGTGKTDTMISILVAAQCERVLVITPTDALRSQISNSILGLGVLKQANIVSQKCKTPIVGILQHKPTNISVVDEIFKSCNVIVTTMAIAGQCSKEIQERMASWCTDLFIDEAHHIAAQTWKDFKESFNDKKITQFTATPFRNDGKQLGGKIIYNYPLGRAQKDGYFRPIKFSPVIEYNPQRADLAISELAIKQLKEDRGKNNNHVLMARVDSIKRAGEIFPLYEKYPEFNPVQIHSGLNSKEKEVIRSKILNGKARIIICVDMFGEGFDLPELKIAAFHDVKKSLPITLQIAGRFVRSRTDLGEPTFIANIADNNVQDELKKLYSQDADWNLLLQQSSESVVQNQIDLWEFLKGFTNFPEDIPLQNIFPALSTVIYKTKCVEWTPDNYNNLFEEKNEFERIYSDINRVSNVLVIVTGKKYSTDWAKIKEIYNLEWELTIAFWDKEQNLLFINGSENEGNYKDLAQLLAGDVELIKDNNVFRTLSGINRLKLQNVGLINHFGKLIKYTMRAGSDIESGLSDIQRGNVRKANIFGAGYENGRRTSIGCSYKGRIWSRRTGNLEELLNWCVSVGKKVLDDAINPDDVLKGTLVSKIIESRPKILPLWIDWPDKLYISPEISYTFIPEDEYSFQLLNAEIGLLDPQIENEIRFEIKSNNLSFPIKLLITKNDYHFVLEGSKKLVIQFGNNDWKIDDFFNLYPPTIYFIDGSTLEGNTFTPFKITPNAYEKSKIIEWDWTNINLKKESQGIEKFSDSIQYRVIEQLKKEKYDFIFDDDDSGEIADVITINNEQKKIIVGLYHCKFSLEQKPGARIDDLYTVCGQAQKSKRWMEKALEKPEEFFIHMLRRESNRNLENHASRIEVGSINLLETLKVKSNVCPMEFKIFIVQPGLSKSKTSDDQLEIFGATQSYLLETGNLPLTIIASS